MIKATPVAIFFKSYVRAHTRRLKSGKVVQVGSYHTDVRAMARVGRAKGDTRTGDLFDGKDSSDSDQNAAIGDPEVELRAMWTEQGVPKARQDELIRQIGDKAKPGAKVGPFTIGEADNVHQQAQARLTELLALRDGLKAGTVKPREIVGTGYKNGRKMAEQHLEQKIKEQQSILHPGH